MYQRINKHANVPKMCQLFNLTFQCAKGVLIFHLLSLVIVYFVEYAFANLIMKSKVDMQNSKLSPVQTLKKSYIMSIQP